MMAAAGCFEVIGRFISAEDIAPLFLQARVVVLPYTEGTQSGVAAMALGYGRPVVATAVGSIPELVRHGENGLLVAPGDSSGLVAALRSIIVDDRLWDSLAQGAVALRDGELCWAAISRQTLAVYAKITKP